MTERDHPNKRPRTSLSPKPTQLGVTELPTGEWAEIVHDFVSTGARDQRSNNERSTIHTNNTTVQSEDPLPTRDSQTVIGNETSNARQTSVPDQAEILRHLISSTDHADRISRDTSDTDLASKINRYLLDESVRPTTGEDSITDSHTRSIIQGALIGDDSSGYQAGSDSTAGNSHETALSPGDQPPQETPTPDPLQAQNRDIQEPRHGLQHSAEFMARLNRLQLDYENEASIVSEGLAGMVAIWDNMQLLFEEYARMCRELADQEYGLRGAIQKNARR